MNTRLEQFLAAENISQSQFADVLGVARASISHILSGRNKPGYEFITNLMRSYPALNIEWLLLGKGKMYKEPKDLKEPKESKEDEEPAASLFDSPTSEVQEPVNQVVEADMPAEQAASERKIIRVTAFYSDGTFEEIG